jgi:hypothetical protein
MISPKKERRTLQGCVKVIIAPLFLLANLNIQVGHPIFIEEITKAYPFTLQDLSPTILSER